ncbi:hypothetical protein B0A52_02870 [Exophiala mesophila]|uniref:Major facilitator superfamily (MFS) profile domain-containing protein n=1 Tax=Exophiala mesophila TaxID=212818 RepID=A0A438NE33_EXOME|nr:hypothetical protein B0A52_02870 [Exophiala mesophila]
MSTAPTAQWSWYNFWICFLVSLGMLAFAYPASIIATTLAQPSFLIDMGLLDVTQDPPALAPNANALIGAISGVFQAGGVVNTFIAGWVADRYGRKWGFHWCSLLSLLGGALQCGAQNSTMFIFGRLFSGAGSAGFLVITPPYSAELSPPKLRGLLVGLNGVIISIGYALGAYMGLAFYSIQNPAAQWRGPLGLNLIWPLLMNIVCLYVPESPRYLLLKDREDEARAIVYKLHNLHGESHHEFAHQEFQQMATQAREDRHLEPSWLKMITERGNRKRLGIAAGYMFFGQSTGVLVLNNYGPTIYAALGFDTRSQLIFQPGWVTSGIIGNLIGAVCLDWIGRKPLLTVGLAGCCVCLIIEAAVVSLYAQEGTNGAGLRAGVAATYLFIFVYGLGVDVAGVVLYSEVFPNHMRARGMSLVVALFGVTNVLYLQVAPTAFANIGWRFFLVFIILSGIGAVWSWFGIPETNGIPLEEMNQIFSGQPVVKEKDLSIEEGPEEHVVVDQSNHEKGFTQGDAEKVCSETEGARRVRPAQGDKDSALHLENARK